MSYRATIQSVGVFLFFVLVAPFPLFAQDSMIGEPLQGQQKIIRSNEILMVWANPDGDNVNEKLYDFVSFGNPALEDSIQAQDRAGLPDTTPYAESQAMGMAVGSFDDDPFDDAIVVWAGPDGRLYTQSLSTSTEVKGGLPQLIFEESAVEELKPAGTLYENLPEPHTIRVVGGQFDEDEYDEVLLAYIGTSGRIEVEAYDASSGSMIVEKTGVLMELPINGPNNLSRSIHFDIATGDLTGDDIDDLVVGTVRQITDGCTANSGCWAATYYLYELTDSGANLLGQVDTQKEESNSNRWLERVAIDIGDLDGDGSNEIAGTIHVPHNGSTHRWYLAGLEWDGSALNVRYDQQFHQTTGSFGFPLSVEAADLDFDGADELVIAGRTLEVYEADSTFQTFTQIAGGTFGAEDNNSGRQYLAVGDVDGGSRVWYEGSTAGIYRPEIVVARSFNVGSISVDEQVELAVFRFTPSQFNLEKIASKVDEVSDATGGRHLMIATGDFGDRGIRVGAPRVFRQTDIVQPLVILNTPPVHYDVFNGSPIDVTGCFSTGCGFAARYTEQASQSVEITTQISGDWQIGAGIEGNLNSILGEIPVAGEAVASLLDALNLGIDFNFEASYGEGFSDLIGSRRTITLTTQVNALEEDVVYADVLNYAIWEYPLFVRGREAGFMAIVIPESQRDQWFTTGSPEAASYRTSHEVGNILSYPKDVSPVRQVQQVFMGSTYTLGSQTISWDITQEQTNFSESTQSTNLSLGGSVDISTPIPTLSVNLNGNYSTRSMNTHSTFVSNLQGVTVEFGQIETNIEGKQANYSVTPFVYWESSGALVVDYAVEPSIAGPGEVATWWQDRYATAPDPAFNLPSRYKDLKTGGTVDDATKTRTRSLAFFPENAMPGEEVTIQALINNYSLLPVSTETTVRFYQGDPLNGGVPITGMPGTPDPVLPPLEARGSGTVSANWVVPSGINDSAVRIYAVIDPDDDKTEIHENNNVGWAPLLVASSTSTEEVDSPKVDAFSLDPAYPNPFSASTRIVYTLGKAQEIRLSVYDVLGREVERLAEGLMPAGIHEVLFNADHHASGMYFYRLQTASSQATKAMILAR